MNNSLHKKVGTIFLLVIIIGTSIVVYNQINAASSEPGTIDDPLVSKSYVDAQTSQIITQVEEMLSNLEMASDTPTSNDEPIYMEDIYQYIDNKLKEIDVSEMDHSEIDNTKTDVSAIFTVIALKAGEKLICDESAEIILRSGEAKTLASELGGLDNVTSGHDLENSDDVPKNHLLIVPRTDCRGIKAITDAYVMVKGGYVIQ